MVEQTETERLIGELELAVDRLRSLYEQYFMGIEKLEPTVPRKDVDRRIHVIRKEQIRNTALRFRFQMLLQRYNTYQTHWQRICRDIENGTYKRHVIRAQQRFGPKRASVRPPPGTVAPTAGGSFAAELAELDREFAPAEVLSDSDVELEEDPPSTRRSAAGARTPGSSRPPPSSARRSPRTPPPRPPPPRTSPSRNPPSTRTPPPRPPPSRTTLSKTPPARTPPAPAPNARSAGPPPSPRSSPRGPNLPGSPPQPPRPAVALRRDEAPTAALPPRVQAATDLPEDRVRQLYTQFIDAKRRQNESTATITYDAVARSLRESSAKLRQRLGRAVDFEVAVKDGRAILRPVVK